MMYHDVACIMYPQYVGEKPQGLLSSFKPTITFVFWVFFFAVNTLRISTDECAFKFVPSLNPKSYKA